jgi:hypothetical protein
MSKKRHQRQAAAKPPAPLNDDTPAAYAPIPPLDTSGDVHGLVRVDGDLMGYWLPPGTSATDIRIRDRTAPPEGD